MPGRSRSAWLPSFLTPLESSRLPDLTSRPVESPSFEMFVQRVVVIVGQAVAKMGGDKLQAAG